MRVYLDNCCLNRPFDVQTYPRTVFETLAKMLVQKNILTGEYELASSYVLDYEILTSPYYERSERIMRWKNVAKLIVMKTISYLQKPRNYDYSV